MISFTRMLILCLVLIGLCSTIQAQDQIPDNSFVKLQDVFTKLRDNLWEKNDEFWHHGEFNRCIAMMRLITQIDPHDTEAYDDGAWLMESELRDREAEAFLREGLVNNPDTYDIYYCLGNFCYFNERFEEAVFYYTASLSFESPTLIRHQLAHAYEHAGYIGESLNTWLEVEAAEPDNIVAANQIERTLQGEKASAVPEMISRSKKERRDEKKLSP